MKKNVFRFILKALVLAVFKFCPDFCGHVGKLLNEKAKVNFKIYYVTY